MHQLLLSPSIRPPVLDFLCLAELVKVVEALEGGVEVQVQLQMQMQIRVKVVRRHDGFDDGPRLPVHQSELTIRFHAVEAEGSK